MKRLILVDFFTEASVASMEATPLNGRGRDRMVVGFTIRVITKLPNSEQSSNGEVKTHKFINRQNQSTTGKL